ncbi:MAG: hypothetical protein JO000_11680 [Alphaproteobacteria bacterium]|nr:hypothetical protein [Alphaproteobacteria bacterium]
MKLLVLGASIACLGGYALISSARHQLVGVRATATFLAYVDACTLEFQRIEEGRPRKTMSCDEAERLQRELGSRKVELDRVPGARFRFALASGEVRELVRSRTVLGNPNMGNGDKFTVVYDPADPDDVRIIPSPIQILLCFGGIPAGLIMMLMALGIRPASALRWLGQTIGAGRTLAASASATRDPDALPPPPHDSRAATTRPGPNAPRAAFGKR